MNIGSVVVNQGGSHSGCCLSMYNLPIPTNFERVLQYIIIFVRCEKCQCAGYFRKNMVLRFR